MASVYPIPIIVLCTFLFSAGTFAASVPIPEEYITVDSGPCRVSVPPQNGNVAYELASTCENSYRRIFRQLGLNRDADSDFFDIRVVGEPNEMKKLAPPGAAPPAWSGAVAYPDSELIILSLRNKIGSPVKALDNVLEHELSHIALRRALATTQVPRWFSEGIAIYQSEESSYERHWILWQAARRGDLLPLNEINRYPAHASKITLAYAQAVDFLGFLLRRDGWLGIRIVIRETAKGALFEEAFEFSYRDTLANLEREWRSGLETKWQWLPLVTGTGAIWGFIVALFFIAYIVVVRRKKRRLTQMAEEEKQLELAIHLPITPPPPMPKPQLVESTATATKIRVDDEIHTLH